MSEMQVLMLLKRELYELVGALSIEENMCSAQLIEELKNALRLFGH